MIQSFFAELKHRKVIRVAGVYAVAGWAILQGAERLFPVLLLPRWTVTFVAMLLLIGFPIALIITWAFELTPEGIRRAPSAAEIGPPPARSTWLELALLVGIMAVIGVSIAQLMRDEVAAPVSNIAPQASMVRAAPATSVAVLPFTSFSADADSNYFADGLTEELINNLAQISGLKVSGRTSAFYFKDRNEDLRDIGAQLGVAHVLEGSVRRSGEKLRITVQLISTADGFHLWSQTYDRGMADIFAIQDDVAQNVAAVLETKLMPSAEPKPPKERDSEAYRKFLVATALLRDMGLEPLTQARSLLEEVIRIEPDNVDALASYAQATMLLSASYLTIDFDTATRKATEAVEHALSLNPGSVNANVASGFLYTTLAHRTDERRYLPVAESALSRAVDLAPNNADVLTSYGTLLNDMERFVEAQDILQRAATCDPLSLTTQFQLSTALQGLGRLGEARQKLETMIAVHPELVGVRLEIGEILMKQGRFAEALPLVQKEHATRSSPRATFALANIYANLGLVQQVEQTIAELDYAPLTEPLGRVILLNLRGDDAATLALAKEELARTNDRLWRPLVISTALIVGELETARAHLLELDPTVLAPKPDMTRVKSEAAMYAANLLLREGKVADATYILERLLDANAPPSAGYDSPAKKILRAKALAQLGRKTAAIEELAAAKAQGFRMVWDFDNFHRLDRSPMLAAIRDEPAFRAVIEEIETDNAATRDRVLQTL